ncbi:MAG: SCO family protein [Aigarchaeota archaeon]|nr:SCO family protein [Aigarchaeota archaeon]MDW8092631.1 SCO family protein [Nitrososphaerota archaeon]
MKKIFLVVLLSVIASFILGFIVFSNFVVNRPAGPASLITLEPVQVPDFTLTDHNGNRFSLYSLRGKIVLLFFGYTNCPDYCPLVLEVYDSSMRSERVERESVALLFISCDPERDTPEALSRFLSRYRFGNVIGLTGSPEELQKVWDEYKVRPLPSPKDEKGFYVVVHPTNVYVLDRDLRLRFAVTFENLSEGIPQAIRYLSTN